MVPIFRKIASSAGFLLQCYCIAHCTCHYLGDVVLCTGPSMQPTIYTNDVLLTEHISPSISRIQRGDIVIAKCPSNPKQQICKRVTALPGDKVRTGFASTEIIPRGHVWLEGDNKKNSTDSRNYGAIPQGLIKGRAILKIWPIDDIGALSD